MEFEERVARVRAEHPGEQIDCYLTFASHTDAMALHEAARAAGYTARISTTPRAIQASCGVALLVSCDDVRGLQQVAAGAGVEIEGTVPLPCQIHPRRDRYC